MSRFFEKAAKELNNITLAGYREAQYFRYVEKSAVREGTVLAEHGPGREFSEVLQKILTELAENNSYESYSVTLACEKKKYEEIKKELKIRKLYGCIKVVKKGTTAYYKALAAAKYLITEQGFSDVFIKQEQQCVVKVSASAESDSSAKTYFDADYIYCTEEKEPYRIMENKLLCNFCRAKLLITADAADFCRRWLLDAKEPELKELEFPYNGKKNIVFYSGDLEKNGLTISCANLLHTLNQEESNYAVLYCRSRLYDRVQDLQVFPENTALFDFERCRCLAFCEQLPYILWKMLKKLPYRFVEKTMKTMAERNARRMFGNSRIHTAVQFSGYHDEMIETMGKLPCNRVIYVHSDMEKEMKLKGNTDCGLLSRAYCEYDSVAVVTEGILPGVERIAAAFEGEKKAHIVLSKNVIAQKRILELGRKELEFNTATVMNRPKEELEQMLSSGKKKFISIGRFSAEKAHDRLIQAFEMFHKENPETCLIIVGGYGNLWGQTVRQAEASSCADSIFLIRYMSNPYPLLARCDYFVLASLYEGFGLVLAEADILGVPCFSTDIPGPRKFMQQYGGCLVENSMTGIMAGFTACLMGEIPKKLSVDYEDYNKEAVEQFHMLVS